MRGPAALTVAALLLVGAADPREGRVAGPAKRCLTTSQSRGFVIERGDLLIYREGRRWWVSRPQRGCQRLHPLDILVIEPFGSQLCAGDRFRTIRPGTNIPSGYCRFGPFVPYVKQK